MKTSMRKVKKANDTTTTRVVMLSGGIGVNADVLDSLDAQDLFKDNLGKYLSSLPRKTEADFKALLLLSCYREVKNLGHTLSERMGRNVFKALKDGSIVGLTKKTLPDMDSVRNKFMTLALESLNEIRSNRTKSETDRVARDNVGNGELEEFVDRYIWLPRAPSRSTHAAGGIDDPLVYSWDLSFYDKGVVRMTVRQMVDCYEDELREIYQVKKPNCSGSARWKAQQYKSFRGEDGRLISQYEIKHVF